MKSLAEVLRDENRALLKVIMETKPQSISALAEATGRKTKQYQERRFSSNPPQIILKRRMA
ncbi:HVO_A0114 family putative DNA-binding protein [Acidithiobacillus marinus]|uniref:HVO_A0114 family putative DNA-binding protein n=1 Tax=Acidithiobacillus marinus TaxID=187490 RepID=UPI003F62D2E5